MKKVQNILGPKRNIISEICCDYNGYRHWWKEYKYDVQGNVMEYKVYSGG